MVFIYLNLLFTYDSMLQILCSVIRVLNYRYTYYIYLITDFYEPVTHIWYETLIEKIKYKWYLL